MNDQKLGIKVHRIYGTDLDDLLDSLDANRGKIKDLAVVYLDDKGYWNYRWTKSSAFSTVIFALEYIKAKMMTAWLQSE